MREPEAQGMPRRKSEVYLTQKWLGRVKDGGCKSFRAQRRGGRSDTSNHGSAPRSGPAHGARAPAEAEPGAEGRGSEEALGLGAWARPAAGCAGPAETDGPEEL